MSLDSSPEAPDYSLETPHSPLYADPYTPPATSHRKITDVQSLDEVSPLLGDRKSWCAHSLRLRGYPKPEVCSGHCGWLRGFLGQGPLRGPRSPVLSQQFLSVLQSSLGPEPSRLFCSVPVSVPVSDSSCGLSGPHLLSEKAVPRARASRHHRASIKGWGPQPPDSPQLVSSSPQPGQGVLLGRGNCVEPSETLREQER